MDREREARAKLLIRLHLLVGHTIEMDEKAIARFGHRGFQCLAVRSHLHNVDWSPDILNDMRWLDRKIGDAQFDDSDSWNCVLKLWAGSRILGDDFVRPFAASYRSPVYYFFGDLHPPKRYDL